MAALAIGSAATRRTPEPIILVALAVTAGAWMERGRYG